MAKTSSVGYEAFASIMLAAQWGANCLLVLLFGPKALRITARVASDCYGHVLARARELGVAISDFSERPVEDLHQRMKGAFHSGLISGGRPTPDEVAAARTIKAMAAERDLNAALAEETRHGCAAATDRRLARQEKKHRARFLETHAQLIERTVGPLADATSNDDGGGSNEDNEDDDDDENQDVVEEPPWRATRERDDDHHHHGGLSDEINDDEGGDDTITTPFEEATIDLISASMTSGRTEVNGAGCDLMIDSDGKPWKVRLNAKANEMRLLFDDDKKPSAASFLRVKVTDIYAHVVRRVNQGNDTEVKIVLARAPDFSEAGAPKLRLNQSSHPRDTSPLQRLSSTAPLLTLRAKAAAKDTLGDTIKKWALRSEFLVARSENPKALSIPSPLPATILPAWMEELQSEHLCPFPVWEAKTDGAKLAYLRREFGALCALIEAHFFFVRSKEKEGAPIKRACGVCKAEVYLSHRGLYATLQGGAAHDSCYRSFAPSAP